MKGHASKFYFKVLVLALNVYIYRKKEKEQ